MTHRRRKRRRALNVNTSSADQFGTRHRLLIPPLFQPNERINDVIALGRTASSEYQRWTGELEGALLEGDPLVVLANLSFYALSPISRRNPWRRDGKPFTLHHAQFLQASALRFDLSRFAHLFPVGSAVEHWYEASYELAEAARLRHYAELDAGDLGRFHAVMLQEAIRNDRHRKRTGLLYEETIDSLLALIAPIAQEYKDDIGLTPADAVGVYQRLASLARARLQHELDFRRQLLRDRSPETVARRLMDRWPDGWTDAQGRLIAGLANSPRGADIIAPILHLIDSRLDDLYAFSENDLAQTAANEVDAAVVLALVDHQSFGFGDLANRPIEHFYFDNPVVSHPFVRAHGRWYLLFPAALITGIEDLLLDIVHSAPRSAARFSRLRPSFLEGRVNQILSAALPGSREYAGSLWRGPDGREGENDLLIQLDSHRIIVEAKSGRIPPRATWGDLTRLRDAMTGLVIEPARQARSFAELLPMSGTATYPKRDGGSNTVTSDGIFYEVRLTVLLEELGLAGSHTASLRRAGLLSADEPAQPTMSVAELALACKLLPTVSDRLRYFERRMTIDRDWSYSGDELDLLTLYLETGFYLPDVPSQGLDLYGISNRLEPLIARQRSGRKAGLPEPIRRPLWKAILGKLEAATPQGWTDLGSVLLRVPPGNQRDIERFLAQNFSAVRSGRGQRVLASLHVGDWEGIRMSFIELAFDSRIGIRFSELSEETAERARRDSNADVVVIIGKDARRLETEFDSIYFRRYVPQASAPLILEGTS